jgi:hypothetical protein
VTLGRAPFRGGKMSKPIEPECNRLLCADRAFANYKQKQQPFFALRTAVLQDANPGAWYAAAICTFEIVITTGLLA